MDQTNDRIEQDVKDILRTRMAISDKLEMLEHRVEEKMERSKTAVQELVDHTAKVVEGMMDKTKQTLDPVNQFRERPWVMLGGAILLGYVAGVVETKMRAGGVYPYYTPDAEGADVMPPGGPERAGQPEEGVYPYYGAGRGKPGEGASRPLPPHMSFLQDVAEGLMEEVDHVKAGLIEAGRAFLREASSQIIPALLHSVGDQVKKRSTGTRDSPYRPSSR